MIYRRKVPLPIGLAGGRTDVRPTCYFYNGAILNAALSLYAYTKIKPLAERKIILNAWDQGKIQVHVWSENLPIDGQLDLLKRFYKSSQKDYGMAPGGLKLTT